jgi:hypothetical protein
MLNNCIVKTLKNKSGDIIWQALYLNGKKEVEDIKLDMELSIKIFNDSKEFQETIIREDDDFEIDLFEERNCWFPEEEDFSYLLDYKDLQVGDIVYLETGCFKVSKTWTSIRKAGYYDYKLWYNSDLLECSFEKMYYKEHEVLNFEVEDSNKSYVWEDYNYQQSFLYLKHQEELNEA